MFSAAAFMLHKKQKKSVLVMGDLMLDQYWYGQVKRISPEAPVPVSQVSTVKSFPGGAANVAVNIAALGEEVSLLGCIGTDAAGAELEQLLDQHAIKHDLIKSDDLGTITKLRLVAQNQQLVRVDRDYCFAALQNQLLHLFQIKMHDADVIVFSDYHKGTLSGISEMIRLAKAAGKTVLVDPKGNDFSLYRHANLITPNLHEFQAIAGDCPDDTLLIQQARKQIAKLHVQALLITLSERGMLLVTSEEHIHLAADAREVFDVTGAGDTVIATLASSLAHQLPLREAVYMANVAAGLAVSHFGVKAIRLQELQQAVFIKQQQSFRSGIVQLNALQSYTQIAKALGEKLVFTNGCFDLLHAGHVRYLHKAKQLGDRLIVAVNTDPSITRIKGKNRPIMPLAERMELLESLAMVDWVIAFDEPTPHHLLRILKPDILVKGGDYTSIDHVVGSELVLAYGGDVKTLNLVEHCSTTRIIEKIQNLSVKN